ncbi:MAG: spore coat protein U domain-containing protein [Burkholderiales bacterium]|nr:spore coat protein U domain-containing protein [Burkholderiales bacterium]
MNRRLLTWLVALLAAGPALAATTCRISSNGGMAFGGYDVLSSAPDDSIATVAALCTRNGGARNVTITLQLNQGSNGTSVSARRMRNLGPAGGFLNYNLFRDSARSAIWGFSTGVDTMSLSLTIPNRGSSTATFTIYGRIPALQDVAVGSYTDSVTVTVTP